MTNIEIISVIKDVILTIAALVGLVSVLITVNNFRREQLNQKISVVKWKREYFTDLLKWSDEAMLLLSEAMHLCDLDPKRMDDSEFFNLRHTLKVKLSAHIDRGRWFFPNYAVEAYGHSKQEAYRGYRHAALDGLVFAYRELCHIDYVETLNNRQHRKAIEHAKRSFTSEIQKVLDPRSRDDEFRKLLGKMPNV